MMGWLRGNRVLHEAAWVILCGALCLGCAWMGAGR